MVVPKVKFQFAAVVMLFLGILILANTNSVQAGWNALNSGYAVTTDYHGKIVPLHADVKATAGTTDSNIYKVEFVWKDPNGIEYSRMYTTFTTTVPADAPQEILDWVANHPSTTVYYTQDTFEDVSVPGWWGVQAIFHGATNGEGSDHDRFKATSFFVIDEVPFGTIVTLLIPFGFLSIYAIKKKHNIRH